MPAQLLTVLLLLPAQVAADDAAPKTFPTKPPVMAADPLRRTAVDSASREPTNREPAPREIVTELGQPVVAKPKPPGAVLFSPGTTAREPVAAEFSGREAAPRDIPAEDAAVHDVPVREAPVREASAREFSVEAAAEPRILRTSAEESMPLELGVDRAAATGLIQHALSAPRDPSLALPGQPWTLQQLLENLSERGQRLVAIKSYWKLSAEVAKYHWSLEELEFLAELPPGRLAGELKMLVAAQADAQAFAQQNRMSATAVQLDVSELLRASGSEAQLWPADLPLVGLYQTKFERIFAGRSAPAQLRRISTQLPQQLELIELRAAAVAAATDSLKELAYEYRQGQVSLSLLLDAQVRLRRLRSDFVDVIRTYNEQIAEYAMAIGGSNDNQTVVSMLIKSGAGQRLTVPAGARLETSAAGRNTFSGNSASSGALPSVGAGTGANPNHASTVRASEGDARFHGGGEPTTRSKGGPQANGWMAPRTGQPANGLRAVEPIEPADDPAGDPTADSTGSAVELAAPESRLPRGN